MLNSYLPLLIFAGIINGSFVVPKKYIQAMSNEKVWIFHSIIGLVLIPWLILFLIFPNSLPYYSSLQNVYLILLVICGAIFGVGQVCFAYAFERIGIALGFTINLAIGVLLGSIFVVFYHSEFFTRQGFLVVLAVLLIVTGLATHYCTHKNNKPIHRHKEYQQGWLLASITGVTSGLQNVCFVILIAHAGAQTPSTNLFWVWPPFLMAAAIPMLYGFSYKMRRKNPASPSYYNSTYAKNMGLIIIMGLCFTGSLALYSLGMSKVSQQQLIIGWPTFMVCIILTSQIWGWFYKESDSTAIKNKLLKICSIALLISAIILLSIAAI